MREAAKKLLRGRQQRLVQLLPSVSHPAATALWGMPAGVYRMRWKLRGLPAALGRLDALERWDAAFSCLVGPNTKTNNTHKHKHNT